MKIIRFAGRSILTAGVIYWIWHSFVFWLMNPKLTQMEVFIETLPHLIITICLVVLGGYLMEWR